MTPSGSAGIKSASRAPCLRGQVDASAGLTRLAVERTLAMVRLMVKISRIAFVLGSAMLVSVANGPAAAQSAGPAKPPIGRAAARGSGLGPQGWRRAARGAGGRWGACGGGGDKAVVEAMAKAKQATLKGTSARGTGTIDTYDLDGFAAMLAQIDKACGVKR